MTAIRGPDCPLLDKPLFSSKQLCVKNKKVLALDNSHTYLQAGGGITNKSPGAPLNEGETKGGRKRERRDGSCPCHLTLT